MKYIIIQALMIIFWMILLIAPEAKRSKFWSLKLIKLSFWKEEIEYLDAVAKTKGYKNIPEYIEKLIEQKI